VCERRTASGVTELLLTRRPAGARLG